MDETTSNNFETNFEYLKSISSKIRYNLIAMMAFAGSGHPGGSLSMVEILATLYYGKFLKYDPDNVNKPDRDRLILSKGHASPTLYVVLADLGYFPKSCLRDFDAAGSTLPKHCDRLKTPGIEASTGSLGHGLSFAIGVALAAKLDKKNYHTYVMLGDGETNEGQIWEAAAAASHYKLDNITALIDRNYLQIDGNTEKIMRLESIRDRWNSFGWYVIEIDGHDIKKILEALCEANENLISPTMIILNTIKGKGVSFMENNVDFHGVPPNKMEYNLAIEELDILEKKLEALN